MPADPLFNLPITLKAPTSFLGTPAGFTGLGAAAEMRLVAELLDRGHKVAIPVVDDDGVDLIVNYRTKVQVKSGARRDPRSGRLVVFTQRKRYERDGVKRLQDHVDVLAAYARDTGTWWLIPRDQITVANAIYLSETAQTGLSAWREAWELFTTNTDPVSKNEERCA